MAYTTIDDPSAYFHTQLYTGTGSELSVTNDANAGDFKPDWIWIKQRNAATNHGMFDSNRGVKKNLKTDSTSAESTENESVKTFNTDGFTLGTSGDYNGSSDTHVAWQWKANGGTTSSNTDGTITSTVQANTTAGFSIVTYTGNFTNNSTVGHGLGAVPKVIIIKNRADAYNWVVYHDGLNFPSDDLLYLNLTNAANQHDPTFNNTAPTSSVFTIGAYELSNDNTDGHVAYCFAEIQGYSKFGSYTGISNDDGAFVYTGFAPAWVMIKRTDTAKNWYIFDNKRPGYNVINRLIAPNLSDAEVDGSEKIDLLSNGFKLRQSFTHTNTDGGTFIYMAFAEHPFVGSDGVPTTAR